jgi:hypothetical protein
MSTAEDDMRDRFGLSPREVATLPPSNHVQHLRKFLDSLRRSRAAPLQEIAHAQESIAELERVIKEQPKGTTG